MVYSIYDIVGGGAFKTQHREVLGVQGCQPSIQKAEQENCKFQASFRLFKKHKIRKKKKKVTVESWLLICGETPKPPGTRLHGVPDTLSCGRTGVSGDSQHSADFPRQGPVYSWCPLQYTVGAHLIFA